MKLSSVKVERSSTPELNMTSMIDVVFLLLIFFMITANYRQTEKELESAIKEKQSGAGSQTDFEPVLIEIVPGGSGYVYRIGGSDYSSQRELEAQLGRITNKADGAFVQVSDGALFGMAATAIQACKSVGFLSVSYIPETGK